MLSVPPEVTANAVFQAAPSWSTRPDPSPAKDVFGALVSRNTPSDPPAAPPPPPPQPSSQAAPPPASPPSADHSLAANNNTPAPASNADSGNAANSGDPSSTNANTAGTTNNANGQASSSQPTTSSSAGTAKSTAQKSQNPQADATSATVDPAILLAQQIGLAATTPTPVPVAAAIAVSTPPTSSPAQAPSPGGPTAPLAIAAAGIAAATFSGTAAAAATTTKTATSELAGAANAPVQTNGADPSVVTTAALTGTVAAAAPVTAKAAQGKTSATTPSADNAATASAPVDPSSSGTITGLGQNPATPPAATGGKPETTMAVPEGTAGAAADAAPTPAASAHDHAAAASTAHAIPDVPDPGAQAVASVQPQLNSASSLTQASNLTVTAAANGPVPLSGVALQIAANVKSGKSSFDIRLDPADLGRIDVRVQIDQNGQVTSHLTVEKPETLSMLQQDAPQLQQALNDAGLKTGGGGLQFSLRDQSSFSQNSGGGSNPNAQQLIISDEDAVPAVIAGRSYGRSLGSSSGVDIRV